MPPTPNFDPLACPYRWLEYLTFGPLLQRTRTHYLPQVSNHKSALILGDGDGRFTAQLLRQNPTIRIHAVDISPAMLHSLAQRAHPHQSRLTTQQADLRHWSPTAGSSYDLVVTHFFLDCLTTEEIAQLAQRLAPSLTPHALWLISDFSIPPTTFGQTIAKPLVATLYQAFRLLTNLRIHQLPNHPVALASQGWTLQHHHSHLRGLLISQLWTRISLSSSQSPPPAS